MLTDLTTCKNHLSISPTDSSQDDLLVQLIVQADQIVKSYCKRTLETATVVEMRDGGGFADLHLYQRPVKIVMATGNTTLNSAVVTGLSANLPYSTANILAGMPCHAPGSTGAVAVIPNNTIVASVQSSTQVTLSQNATATQTGLVLAFGLDVYLDAGGYYGQGVTPFATQTRLLLGRDYVLKVDQPDGSSKSGIIRRLGGGPSASILGWPWGWETRQGTLTARLAPVWINWYGNLQCVYTAGLGTGVGQVPADLTLACTMLVASLRRIGPAGVALDQEHIGRYQYQLSKPMQGEAPEMGTIRQLLSRYREIW